MTRKFKEIEESKVFIKKSISEWIGEDGNVCRQLGPWEEAKVPINLGSNKEPNTEIKLIKFEVPEDKPTNIFEGLFRAFGG